LARYEKRALSGLAGDRRMGAERILGKAVDFVGVSFLELARAAASTVERVVFQNLQPIGSGFMISDSLFLTNNHVIPSRGEAKQYLVEFNYEMDINRQPKAVTRFTLNPDEFFITNPYDQLDFTIVAIGKCVDGKGNLYDFGYCPLTGASDKHVLSEFVNIIQYPEGDHKQIVIHENRIVARFENVLHYLADTMPGSSGSPVFNDQWEAIALHHLGKPTRLTTPDGKSVRKYVNEAARISKILSELESKRNSVSEAQRIILDQALNPPFRYPSIIVGEHSAIRRISPLE
jgi:endonuclease G